jgi:hypothetical protein
MNRRTVIDGNPLPKGLAGVHESRVLLAILLIVLVILEIFEMERQGVIERVIGDRSLLGRGWFPDKAVNEIGDFLEQDDLAFKGGVLFGCEILPEPEKDGVDHGGDLNEGLGRWISESKKIEA